ncbi:MAG: winged helix-turn-helix domain-containing protein [Candidatus Cybelea sp.]
MRTIPVFGGGVPRVLRTVAVTAIAFAALGLFLQIFVAFGPNSPAVPDFWTTANVVRIPDKRARAAGISWGDRIDYSAMPVGERYGSPNDGLRAPPAGKPVHYVVEHHGRRHVVTLAALRDNPRTWGLVPLIALFLLVFAAYGATFVVLVLLGSALALIKPTGLTIAFLLILAPYGAIIPQAYFFLPPLGYAVCMAVCDILAALGPIGFLALALYLDPRRQIRLRQVIGVGALLLAVIVVPVATSDAFELMIGTRPAWPIAGWLSFSAVWFCYVAGIVLLLQLAATEPRTLRQLAALLAAIGAATLFGWIMIESNSWYFANLPTAVINRWLLPDRWNVFPFWWSIPYQLLILLKPLGLLVAFYLIVRSKIVDAGPVLSRMIVYVVVVLLVVTGFTFVNLLFAQVFPGYALLVPFEIFAALAIGYWVSGLRDLAGCLSLASVDAWNAWAKGNAREERDALTHSLRLAERTRRPGVIAEVRAQIAFSAWRDGDDPEFERNADALVRVLGDRNMRGLRGFALAVRSENDELCFQEQDLMEWKARAALIRCARTDDAAHAQQHATDALFSADGAGLPSLQILASIAVAETNPDRRDDSLERAHAIARDAGWPALSKSILALRANARDIGMLQPLVEVRLRKSRPARPAFEVSFFNAELRQNGTRIPLAENELELLLAVASAPAGLKDTDLIDDLWPESDGDAARNAFRVCLHRLRKKSGDARIVTRVGKGYVVHPWADVDLWRFQSLVATCRESGGRKRVTELRELCDALRAGERRRGTLGEWFYRFEQMLTRKLDEAERFLDRASTRGA